MTKIKSNIIDFEKEFQTLPNQRKRFLRYKFGNNRSYNTTILIEIDQPIELQVVNAILLSLMEKHEVLRTLYYYENNNVRQRVYCASKFKCRLHYQDISKTRNKEKLYDDFSNYIFDLENEPAFKCILAKYTDKKYIFAMVLDHIIYDAASIKIIEKELYILYEAFISGKTLSLESKKIRFSDFVEHYYQHYHGKSLDFHSKYFKKLFDEPALIPHTLKIKEQYFKKTIFKIKENKIDSSEKKKKRDSFPSSETIGDLEVTDYNGYCFFVPKKISTEIMRFSKISKLTPSVFLLASFCSFLQRANYQDDIIIDIPISLRDNALFSEVVGWLDSALLVRINIKNISFDNLILKCRDILYEAFNHRYYQQYFAHFGDFKNHIPYTSCQLNIIDNLESKISPFNFFQFKTESTLFDFEFQIDMFENGFRVSCKHKDELTQKLNFPMLCEDFSQVLRYQTQRLKESLNYH